MIVKRIIVIKTVITQFYFDTDYIPPEICVQYAPNSIKELTVWLKDKNARKAILALGNHPF